MFDFKTSTAQILQIELDIHATSSLFEQALKSIGTHKSTDLKSPDIMILTPAKRTIN
jgi:hypothetical protein